MSLKDGAEGKERHQQAATKENQTKDEEQNV
jgi:hypothetical protein